MHGGGYCFKVGKTSGLLLGLPCHVSRVSRFDLSFVFRSSSSWLGLLPRQPIFSSHFHASITLILIPEISISLVVPTVMMVP